MSIPPLVCSTPPPPDQCEDDKDPDDFDLHYSLSQEDDDDAYEYGGFTNYNQFQPSPSKSSEKPDEILPAPVVQSKNERFDDKIQINENIPKTFITSECKVEEEINIEDLNLNIDDDVIEKSDVTEIEARLKSDDVLSITDNIENSTIIDSVITEQDETCTSALPNTELFESLKDTSIPNQTETHENKEDDPVDLIENEENVSQEIIASNDNEILFENYSELDQIPVNIAETANKLDNLEAEDTDFGDFDEFHCVSGDSRSAPVLESCDNPWASAEPANNDFGDFKANFDSEFNFTKPETTFVHSDKNDQNQTGDELAQENKIGSKNDDDDGFCDFEEFQSSAGSNELEVSKEEAPCQQVPFLNLRLQDNEDQFLDNVNKVLYEIFEHEIPEIEQKDDLGVKLESLLGETWGHLLEIDTRQPYMVNWNNSLGQKTVLKALCIDSRNILFGPKWNYNMPKYAANLSVAPLQPQKQAATPTTVGQSETTNTDNSVAKTGTWSDSFNTETQESCNPDSASDKPVVESRPIDLDAFEAPPSTIPDKIYSSTLNVQPIRQINLPDTHIFTPTDSETPRSKTIHYDNVSPVLLQQTIIDNKKLQSLTPQPSTSSSNVDEYWEFQDFKSSAQTGSNIDTPIKTPNISQVTQVLEPIKIEPVMPTLNWPDPGEVKTTFDDFSDFISNTTWNNEKPHKHDISTTHITTPVEISKPVVETKTANVAVDSPINETAVTKDIKNLDDEFDTFQSALPPKASAELNVNFGSTDNNDNIFASMNSSSHLPAQNSTGFDNGLNINCMQSPTTVSHVSKVINKSEPAKPIKPIPNILQPTVAKPQQILQPLSLEGYSQINWPNPGIDLQDLSRFNPVETLNSLKTDLSTNSNSKMASPVHNHKSAVNNHQLDDDWGEFVSIKPKQQPQPLPKKSTFPDDDEWTDFISSPNVKPQNGLNTISFNVHSSLNTQKTSNQNKVSRKTNQAPLDIPTLNYVTPKSGSATAKSYNERHFQNL